MSSHRIGLAMPLVAAALLSACITTRMYEGAERSKAEIGRFYTHESRPNIQFLEIDGKAPTSRGPKILQLLPGAHVFDVEATNYVVKGYFTPTTGSVITYRSDHYEKGRYRFEVPIRAGYTYAVDHPNNFEGPLPDKLCVLGEPHNAPGSSEDYPYTIRGMSDKAEVVACSTVRDKQQVELK